MARHINIAAPIVILLALLLALPNPALAASFTLTPVQPSVAAGKTIDIIGTGFTQDEQVAIWATAPDQTVISGDFEFAEGAEGRIDIGFDVPQDALGGRWSSRPQLARAGRCGSWNLGDHDPGSAERYRARHPVRDSLITGSSPHSGRKTVDECCRPPSSHRPSNMASFWLCSFFRMTSAC